jgi:glyoxalase family protein
MGAKRDGIGLWNEIYLTVPAGTLPDWQEQLEKHGVEVDAPEERFGERALPFRDPHGLALALVESDPHEEQGFTPWRESPVPAELQIRGLGGARMTVREADQTIRFLTGGLGFEHHGYESGYERYIVGAGRGGQRVDLREVPQGRRGAWGVGAVHHVAFRVPDHATQMKVRAALASLGRNPTEVIDRFWFQSVYVLEPGGCLCELATDGPGFSVDEKPEHLGETLVLPSRLEPHREEIERSLPDLHMPVSPASE